MSVADSLRDLHGGVAQTNSIISAAYKTDPAVGFFFTATEQQVLVQSAFLRLFIAWETFLEATFIEYMLGGASTNGIAVQRYVQPIDEQHAQKIVIGGLRFMDWANVESVRKQAKLYFTNGNPFEAALAPVNGDLLDLRTVRNAAAHLSSTTNAQLDALASRKLSTPLTNVTVAQFVMAADPASPTGASMLQTYEAMLLATASAIAAG